MIRYLLLFLFAAFQIQAYSSSSHIEGIAKDYAGEEISFYCWTDAFFDLKEKVFSIKPDQEGKFSADFNIPGTRYLFTETSTAFFFIFAEPGNSYKVTFPETIINPDQTENSFFRRPEISLNIIEVDGPEQNDALELNHAIASFNKEFIPFLNEQTVRYYNRQLNNEKLDSFLQENYKPLNISDKDYFERYLKLKKGILEFHVINKNIDQIKKDYFTGKAVEFHNPAYKNLFKMVFEKYFNYLKRKSSFDSIYYKIHQNSLPEIIDYLKKDPVLVNDSILEQVMLHEFYLGYYSGDLVPERIELLTRQLMQESKLEISGEIAELLIEKFYELRTGQPAPAFNLYSKDSTVFRLTENKGLYNYIVFCSFENRRCYEIMEYLKYYHKQHNKYLRVITIIPATDPVAIKKIIDRQSYDWTILLANPDNPVFKDYKAIAFPVFYLTDREGNLLLSPAPAPDEGFEYRLFRILKTRNEI